MIERRYKKLRKSLSGSKDASTSLHHEDGSNSKLDVQSSELDSIGEDSDSSESKGIKKDATVMHKVETVM
jgi:hypothetical protein